MRAEWALALLLSALPATAQTPPHDASVSPALSFNPGSGPWLMERVTVRDLGDAQLIVRRQYLLTLTRDGTGHAGLAQLQSIAVEAPRRLAMLARRMEARERGTVVLFLLDGKGRIIAMGDARDPDDSRLRADLAIVARQYASDPFPAVLAAMNTDQVAGWPAFLFAPQLELAMAEDGLWHMESQTDGARREVAARIEPESGMMAQLDIAFESGPATDRRQDRDRFMITRQTAVPGAP